MAMMEITKRPYTYNFSGNQVVYELLDNDAIADPSIAFQVKLLFKRLDEAVYKEIITLTLSPVNGVAACDLSGLLNPLLTFGLPTSNSSQTSISSGGGYFYIQFRTITPTNFGGWDNSESEYERMIFKGGINPIRFKGNSFFNYYLSARKPFFTWQESQQLVSLNQPIYLGWLNLLYSYPSFEPQAFLRFVIDVFYTDGSSSQITYNIPNLEKGWLSFLPAGATQIGIDLSKPVWYWQCYLKDESVGGMGIISEKIIFFADNRNDYNQLTILYRNSLGGIDSVRIRGIIVKSIEHQTALIDRSAAPGYSDQNNFPSIQQFGSATEILRYKADIGYLSKEAQERLRDAFLMREVWIIKDGRWIPLSISRPTDSFTQSDAVVWKMPIEFTIADGGSDYYTPENVDMGNLEPSNNTCGGAVVIDIPAINVDSPVAGTTRIVFPYDVVGTGIGLQWKIPGFQDEWQDMPFSALGNIEYLVSSGTDITLQMRIRCSDTVFSQISQRFVSTNPDPAEPNSTIYNETAIETGFSVLVNGTVISTGILPASGYVGIFVGAYTGATIHLVTNLINPSEAELFIVDTTYMGSVSGNTSKWAGRNTTSAGVTFTIR